MNIGYIQYDVKRDPQENLKTIENGVLYNTAVLVCKGECIGKSRKNLCHGF